MACAHGKQAQSKTSRRDKLTTEKEQVCKRRLEMCTEIVCSLGAKTNLNLSPGVSRLTDGARATAGAGTTRFHNLLPLTTTSHCPTPIHRQGGITHNTKVNRTSASHISYPPPACPDKPIYSIHSTYSRRIRKKKKRLPAVAIRDKRSHKYMYM